ncbi:hypothetical protein [Streptomyces sp. NBC_00199]|uniref:hypothetical protein n=1 Tax=Streptomyces sp. NBC_00199 TaxID=2975678 RepID=UPI00225658F0|nr:hypothetical protein [Streptomyces sp. NBC_00199]MCX5270030.1 hypothetical protein [Streptomyces sp. NBC_00199]
MTRLLALAHTCLTLAFTELAATAWLLAHHEWLLGILAVWAAPSLLAAAGICRRAHHRARAKAHRAAQLKTGKQCQPLMPCCPYWTHSDGQVHGPGCTRLPLPRRDTYRLDDAGRAAFDEIVRHYHDRSAA